MRFYRATVHDIRENKKHIFVTYMVKRLIYILISSYYLVGNLVLPCSDFSTLVELPGMYNHCKATEDKDMTVVDFITDHLLNIDGALDKHDNGDRQKPHKPFEFNHTIQTVIFSDQTNTANSFVRSFPVKSNLPVYREDFYRSDYSANILRPPII